MPGGAYLLGVASYAPTFLLWSSPGYSNNGFILLGLAMANVTGQTVGKLYQNNIFDALAIASTFSDPPKSLNAPVSL